MRLTSNCAQGLIVVFLSFVNGGSNLAMALGGVDVVVCGFLEAEDDPFAADDGNVDESAR